MYKLKTLIVCLSLFLSAQCHASIRGKADIGVVHADIDITHRGSVDDTLSLNGISTNATLVLDDCRLRGLTFKPKFLFADGDAKYINGSLGLGFYIPVDNWGFCPSVGIGFSELDYTGNVALLGLTNIKKEYETTTKSVGIDASYSPNCDWSFSFGIDYAWADTKATIGGSYKTKTQSKGFNYVAMVDYFFAECWSVNFSYALMKSMSKEKDGNEAVGYRLGLGRRF